MKINNFINNLYYGILVLIPVGWVLNWKYYFSRFQSEGFGWIGWLISISLVLFASVLFSCSQFLKIKKNKIWILFFIAYIILALYSINCTAAGQYWDQQVKNKETNVEIIDKENTSYWIDRYKKKIADSEKEIERLNKVKGKSIDDLSDMYYYKNTSKTVRQLVNEEYEKIKSAEIELKKLTDENKISAKNQDNIEMSKTLYIFYRIIFNMPKGNEENIQFIFQIFLSIIIESIAQMSIFGFMKIKYFSEIKPEITKKIVPTIPEKLIQNELRHFSIIAWKGIETKQITRLVNKNVIMSSIKKVCHQFTESKYEMIIKKGKERNLIKENKDGIFPASIFVTKEFFYQNMCKFMNFT